ncbi:MAG: hypothetical protein O7B25_10025 [Gammaproteobacteria bacterium]|nr:hypothetical protein [Gammaproteobacteria bacterium]
MAKNQHTFAKRQREMEKKRKAEEKRARRHNRNKDDSNADSADAIDNASAQEPAQEVDNQPQGTPERPLSVTRQR